MVSGTEKTKSTFLSWSTAGRIGFTVIFFFWIYMIWISTADLDAKLNAATDQNNAIHTIQVEFKNEVQDWKDLLLRSTNQDTLNTNWQAYETQYQKVAAQAQTIIRLNETPAVKEQIKTFIDAHAANHEQYKKSLDLLVKNSFDPHSADTAVKGIDRPLLVQLEATGSSMEEDKKRIEKGLVDQTRSDIEEKLIALAFLSILAVWLPRY
jgi:methyl-accepting chemotaxis protein